MAIESVHELFDGRAAALDFEQRKTYTRVFEVLTTSDDDGPGAAGDAPGILLGDSHPQDVSAVCVALKPSQDSESPRRWTVAVEYDSRPDTPDALQPNGTKTAPGDREDNPVSRRPTWKGSFQAQQVVLRSAYLTDGDGVNIGGTRPVINSAGFLFDPAVMVEEGAPVCSVTKQYQSIDLNVFAQVYGSVNETTWNGLPPRVGRCTGIEWGSQFENGEAFWSVTWQIALKEDTWDIRVLDAGTCERIITGTDPVTGKPIGRLLPIVGYDGTPITEPVPLNGNGMRLPPGDPEVYLLFSGYKQREWNALIF